MPSTQDIVKWIIEDFDKTKTCTIELIAEKVLLKHGIDQYEAPVQAEDKAEKLLLALQKVTPELLPFEFSDTNSRRLIGKQRFRPNDSQDTKALRQKIILIDTMIEEIYKCGDLAFERICAGAMHLSGAKEGNAICSGDEGGIDIYGRLPIRLSDPHVRNGLLRTAILEKNILFLGQCKCQKHSINPGNIDNFHGAADSCLRKYEGNAHPPSHRVPEDYYRRQEMCIKVFFTISDYSTKASAKADSLDITCIDGKQIAEFLIYHGIGLAQGIDGPTVNQVDLLAWADSQKG